MHYIQTSESRIELAKSSHPRRIKADDAEITNATCYICTNFPNKILNSDPVFHIPFHYPPEGKLRRDKHGQQLVYGREKRKGIGEVILFVFSFQFLFFFNLWSYQNGE